MKIFYRIMVCLFFLQLISTACNDILNADLEDEKLVALAPIDGLTTVQQSITFWWEDLDIDEVTYRFDLVTPSFEAAENFLFREEVDAGEESITKTLTPGIYQWRIVASNASSSTATPSFDLTITSDSTNDLSNLNLAIISPEIDEIFTTTSLQLLWQALSGADFYKAQIGHPDFSNSSFILLDEETENDFVSVDDLTEGEYQWRVRAENENSFTQYTYGTFSIDLTPPIAPVLLNPIAGDSLSLPILMSWQSAADAAFDSLFIYSDSLQNNLILTEQVNGNSYFLDGVATGQKYFWQVGSTDQAGLNGPFSAIGQFFVDE